MLCSGLVPTTAGIEREAFEANFEQVPQPFTPEERKEWLKGLKGVAVSSDAFVSINHHLYTPLIKAIVSSNRK